MEETDRTLIDDEGEETMVAPRFDNEETVLARPVVPLEEVGAAAATPHSGLRRSPRRSLVAALVLVSTLVGSALGVAGLYFYQKHRSTDADAPATQQQQADLPAPSEQPTPAPESESLSRATDAPARPSVPEAAEPDARVGDEADTAKGKDSKEAEGVVAVERRKVSENPDPVVTPKRGKKGDRDEEVQRGERRARRSDEDRPARSEDRGDEREARRVGVITYRPRRARPRRDSYGDADRLRRIFEGQP